MEPYFQEAGEAWEKLSLGGGIQMEEPMLEKEPLRRSEGENSNGKG